MFEVQEKKAMAGSVPGSWLGWSLYLGGEGDPAPVGYVANQQPQSP